MGKSVKKYAWLLLSVVILIAMIYHSRYTFRTLNNEKTTEAIVQLDQLVKSQDKVVTRVYKSVAKEVREKDAEIKSTVKALSPDVVAISLDALVREHRMERDGGD